MLCGVLWRVSDRLHLRVWSTMLDKNSIIDAAFKDPRNSTSASVPTNFTISHHPHHLPHFLSPILLLSNLLFLPRSPSIHLRIPNSNPPHQCHPTIEIP